MKIKIGLIVALSSFHLVACETTKAENGDTTEQTVSNEQQKADEQILEGSPLDDFVPFGYDILEQVSGHLNGDNYKDVVLVLSNAEETTAADDDEFKRPVIILFGTKDGNYIESAYSDNAVLSLAVGGPSGDLFSGVKIEKGKISIVHSGGGEEYWHRTLYFAYSDNQWLLEKDVVSTTFVMGGTEKVTTKTAKDFGKVKFEDFNIYKNQ